MGAWGVKYFDNDDAGDFMGDLAESRDWSTVTAALNAAIAVGDEYLEAPERGAAIAAAAVVANRKAGLEVSDFPDDLVVIGNLGPPTSDIVGLALKAVARVQTEPSELLGLWAEADQVAEWLTTLSALDRALSI
jgi:hypothetical protein